MDPAPPPRAVAAPRLTAILGLILAVGVLVQGLSAGAFLVGDHQWYRWHEILGTALVLPPVISVVASLVLWRRQPDRPSVLATRIVLLALVILVVAAGLAGRGMLPVHIPAAVAVVGIAVRQATGFVRVPNIGTGDRARISATSTTGPRSAPQDGP